MVDGEVSLLYQLGTGFLVPVPIIHKGVFYEESTWNRSDAGSSR